MIPSKSRKKNRDFNQETKKAFEDCSTRGEIKETFIRTTCIIYVANDHGFTVTVHIMPFLLLNKEGEIYSPDACRGDLQRSSPPSEMTYDLPRRDSRLFIVLLDTRVPDRRCGTLCRWVDEEGAQRRSLVKICPSCNKPPESVRAGQLSPPFPPRHT